MGDVLHPPTPWLYAARGSVSRCPPLPVHRTVSTFFKLPPTITITKSWEHIEREWKMTWSPWQATMPQRQRSSALTYREAVHLTIGLAQASASASGTRTAQHCRLQHPRTHVHGQQLLAYLVAGLSEARHGACVTHVVARLCRLPLPLLQLLRRSEVREGQEEAGG